MMETNDAISYLKKFHEAGWMPGSIGALAQLVVFNESSKKIFVTPDNLDINTLSSGDLFVLRDLYGTQDVQAPLKGNFVISKWASTFFMLLGKTGTSCIAFLSTRNSCLVSMKAVQMWRENSESHPNLLRLGHWGLIKDLGIPEAEVTIPIIDCGAEEAVSQIENVFNLYSDTFPAILVRNYGVLTWERSLSSLRNRVEILERLFDLQMSVNL